MPFEIKIGDQIGWLLTRIGIDVTPSDSQSEREVPKAIYDISKQSKGDEHDTTRTDGNDHNKSD